MTCRFCNKLIDNDKNTYHLVHGWRICAECKYVLNEFIKNFEEKQREIGQNDRDNNINKRP